MSKLNELVQKVCKESNNTLVRSQRLAIAKAVAEAFQRGQEVVYHPDMQDEVRELLVKGDDSFIE